MKMAKVLAVLGVLFVAYAGFWYWQSLAEVAPAMRQSDVAQAANQCDLIASKAAAGLPEALPFQQLEKAARQSRVLERCMQDRGYQENPAWVAAATKAAQRLSHEQSISAAEAYETLRRQAMLQAEPGAVGYWRKQG
ncbi:hypothetical protein [Methylophilus sp. 5]|uniref:hypothetical protein n=1 Tax=Methylophilus sp. 5 TaxID=1112274 RepID=UPI00049047E6|nr:hypothetical protein [Methylophilus sp. 5]